MKTRLFIASGLTLLVAFLGGCGSSQNAAAPTPKQIPKLTMDMLVGSWEGGADGEVKSRGADFGKDGKGQVRVDLASKSFTGEFFMDFTFTIDSKAGVARLLNTVGNDKESRKGRAELTEDGKLHIVLGGQDCILSRTAVKK